MVKTKYLVYGVKDNGEGDPVPLVQAASISGAMMMAKIIVNSDVVDSETGEIVRQYRAGMMTYCA